MVVVAGSNALEHSRASVGINMDVAIRAAVLHHTCMDDVVETKDKRCRVLSGASRTIAHRGVNSD